MSQLLEALERIPPQNLEAEQCTLGSMMLEAVALHKSLEVLTAADFYRPTHQEIFDALSSLSESGEPVDLITLQEELRKRGRLEDCGGTEYLMALVNSIPTAANIEYYAAIVHDKSVRRRMIAACTESMGAAMDEEHENPADVMMQRAVELAGASHGSRARHSGEIMHSVWERFEGYREGRGGMGIRFGIGSVDRMLYGVGPGELTIIGGRPSQGKTVLLQHLLYEAAKAGKTPLLFTNEMTTEEVMERVVCMEARIDSNDARDNRLTSEEWHRVADHHAELSNVNFIVDDMPCPLTRLCARARRAKINDDIGIVLIDYLQLIECDIRGENRDTQLSTVTRTLKNLAKELNVPVVVPSQLSRNIDRRDAKERKPILSDLRDGGNQEGNADKVILIHNPLPDNYKPGDKLESRRCELIIAKHRGGRVGTVAAWFTPFWTRFDDVAVEETPVQYNLDEDE